MVTWWGKEERGQTSGQNVGTKSVGSIVLPRTGCRGKGNEERLDNRIVLSQGRFEVGG